MSIPFTDTVANLPATTPFVGPETLQRQRGRDFKLRIGANESAWGMSPLAREAMINALDDSRYYADPESHELRSAIAHKHGVALDEVCVDGGIDTLLGLMVRMLVSKGDKVVSSLGAYPTFNYHVAGFGGELHTVPYKGFFEDPEALLAETLRLQASVVYFANPDNPMGTCHPAATVQTLIDGIPENTVLALDEAYIEFANEGNAPAIDTSNPRVLRFRTFSKAYGMAGQRVGYAIGHRDLISGLNKIRNHFGLNRVAQTGALVSLSDEAFLADVLRMNREARARVMQLAADNNLYAEPSSTNFVAVDMGSQQRAVAMIAALADEDVFMRMPGVAPLNSCIRVGLCRTEDYEYFKQAFEKSLAATAG
mgnify:CR=1 FL=1